MLWIRLKAAIFAPTPRANRIWLTAGLRAEAPCETMQGPIVKEPFPLRPPNNEYRVDMLEPPSRLFGLNQKEIPLR
jgi:hypothetical protein